jgi:hypothetical protein
MRLTGIIAVMIAAVIGLSAASCGPQCDPSVNAGCGQSPGNDLTHHDDIDHPYMP